MTLGNLVAIQQTNIKRMLAYSSIAHAGYVLMGSVLLSQEGLFAMLYYLVVYLFMNLGAFYIVIIVFNKYGTENIEDYAGLGFKAPFIAVGFSVFLFSLTGIPPTAGFIGKFYLFAALIKAGSHWYWLAILGIINSVISLYYYVNVMRLMFLKDQKTVRELYNPGVLFSTVVILLIIPTLILGVYWSPLVNFTLNSLKFYITGL
jgi:NADH-quinone oxidoreductase subunit N